MQVTYRGIEFEVLSEVGGRNGYCYLNGEMFAMSIGAANRHIDTILTPRSHFSALAENNLITMSLSNQSPPGNNYTMPSWETRRLRSRLMIEEPLETVLALGVRPMLGGVLLSKENFDAIEWHNAEHLFDMAEAIDGCLDTEYVSVGTLMALGVPDVYHRQIVSAANLAKFPGMKAIVDCNGKFQKPAGWQSPNHSPNPRLPNVALRAQQLLGQRYGIPSDDPCARETEATKRNRASD